MGFLTKEDEECCPECGDWTGDGSVCNVCEEEVPDDDDYLDFHWEYYEGEKLAEPKAVEAAPGDKREQ